MCPLVCSFPPISWFWPPCRMAGTNCCFVAPYKSIKIQTTYCSKPVTLALLGWESRCLRFAHNSLQTTCFPPPGRLTRLHFLMRVDWCSVYCCSKDSTTFPFTSLCQHLTFHLPKSSLTLCKRCCPQTMECFRYITPHTLYAQIKKQKEKKKFKKNG